MNEPVFSSYALVGGTALALQIGHRISEDIDLFGSQPIDHDSCLAWLNEKGSVRLIKKSPNILICTWNNIKVDFVCYPYFWIDKVLEVEALRLASMKDIAAMKLNAIAGRGSRKDFIDIYFLLKYFSLDEMVFFYLQKYHDGSEFLVRKSLTYFEDAESEAMPLMIQQVSWDTIKETILEKI
jgi:hypothetical protein